MIIGVLLVILIPIQELLVQSLETAIILPAAILPQVIRHIAIALRLIQLTAHLLTVLHRIIIALRLITTHIVYPPIPHQVTTAVVQFTHLQLAYPLTATSGTKSGKRKFSKCRFKKRHFLLSHKNKAAPILRIIKQGMI